MNRQPPLPPSEDRPPAVDDGLRQDPSDVSSDPYGPPQIPAQLPPPQLPPKSRWQKPQPHIGWAVLWSLALFGVQLILGLGGGILFAIYAFATGTSLRDLGSRSEEMIVFLVPLGTLTTLLTALGICLLFFRNRTPQVIAWRSPTLTQGFLTLLAVIPLAVLASEVANLASRVLPVWNLGGLDEFGRQNFAIVFIGACLLPGLGEEIFFRGFLSRGLVARHGVWLGGFFAAFLFGAIHVEPIQSCAAFFLGMGLQYLFLTTRSLIVPIIAHTLNNAFAFAIMRMDQTFVVPGISNAEHTPPLMLLSAFFGVVTVFALLYQTRTCWVDSNGDPWDPGYVATEIPDPQLGFRASNAHPSWLLMAVALALVLGVVATMVAFAE